MRKILLLIPLALLAGCSKYGSAWEAGNACNDWAAAQSKLSKPSFCHHDEPTKQLLGHRFDNKVHKRFHY